MNPPPTDFADLAQSCLDHLRREEQALEELANTLQQRHESLLSGDVQVHASPLAGVDSLDEARQAFRYRCAVAFCMRPEEVTLSRIIERLPSPWSVQIRDVQERLQKLASGIQQSAQRSATVLAFCRSYMRQLWSIVSGGSQVPERYGPGGSRIDDSAGVSRVVSGVL